MDLYIAFFLIAIGLLLVEVTLGFALGLALSGSISFLLLGMIEWVGLPKSFNDYLLAGITTFLISTIIVIKVFKKPSSRKVDSSQDINDY
jgi:hypothetical protein